MEIHLCCWCSKIQVSHRCDWKRALRDMIFCKNSPWGSLNKLAYLHTLWNGIVRASWWSPYCLLCRNTWLGVGVVCLSWDFYTHTVYYRLCTNSTTHCSVGLSQNHAQGARIKIICFAQCTSISRQGQPLQAALYHTIAKDNTNCCCLQLKDNQNIPSATRQRQPTMSYMRGYNQG